MNLVIMNEYISFNPSLLHLKKTTVDSIIRIQALKFQVIRSGSIVTELFSQVSIQTDALDFSKFGKPIAQTIALKY
jgi:hypothetical protein